MGERPGINPKEQSQIKDRKIGEFFMPLEGICLPSGLRIVGTKIKILAEASFKFKGIKTSMVLRNTLGERPEETPLGEVITVLIQNAGKPQIIEEPPLYAELDIHTANIEKIKMLQKYALELSLGNDRYYFRMGGDDYGDETFRYAKQIGRLKSTVLIKEKNNKFSDTLATFPYSNTRLAAIRARVVEKVFPESLK